MMPTFTDFDWKCINTLKMLSLDMVQTANSGHPGAPLGLSPLMHVLATKVMHWHRGGYMRDRLVLSNGHACALQYALLRLQGILTEEDIRGFRQLDSRYIPH
jgi:transketolase